MKPASKISGEILYSYRFIATWSVQQLLASLCRQPAPVCPAIDEIRYNSTGNPWQSERLSEMHQNQANVFESIRVSTEFPKWNSSTFPWLFSTWMEKFKHFRASILSYQYSIEIKFLLELEYFRVTRSYLNTEKGQVVEIILHGRQWYVFSWLWIPKQLKGP